MGTDILNNALRGRHSEQVAYFAPLRGHMRNPGMGIVAMALSDHMVTGWTPADRKAGDESEPFALTQRMLDDLAEVDYIDNIYIRVGWNDVQRRAGQLELNPAIEMAVDMVRRTGRSWGLRVMQCSPSNPTQHTVPEFLIDKLDMAPMMYDVTWGPKPRLRPTYTDEYLKYWDEMLALLGERFDVDPALEYADVSGYGFWGECHHGSDVTDSPTRTREVISTLIDSHSRAFPLTPPVFNLHIAENEGAAGEPGRRAIAGGGWVRRDSYYDWFQAHQALDGLRRKSDAAMLFETIMPGMEDGRWEDPSFQRGDLLEADSMCDYGANYATVGFNPLDTLYADREMPQVFDAFKERLGYRLRPSVVWRIEGAAGATDATAVASAAAHAASSSLGADGSRTDGSCGSLILGMVNDGCATPPGDVTFTARVGSQRTHATVNGGKFSGRMTLVELPLPDGCGQDDTVFVSMALTTFGKTHPARFATQVGPERAPMELPIRLDR